MVHSFEFDYAFGIIKLFFLCCITEKYTSPPPVASTACAVAHIKPHSSGEALSENFIPTTICTTDAPTGTHGGPPGRGVNG